MTEHPSPFELEEWAVGEGGAEVGSHIAQCSLCTDWTESWNRGQARFLQRRPTDAFLDRVFEDEDVSSASVVPLRQGRARRTGWMPATFAAIAAAAAILVALLPSDGPVWKVKVGAAPDVRLRGDWGLQVVAVHGDTQRRLSADFTAVPGERLRVIVSQPAAGDLVVAVKQGDRWFVLARRVDSPAGEHLVEQGLAVDDTPAPAFIVAGPADAVRRAQLTGTLEGVAVIRVDTVSVQ